MMIRHNGVEKEADRVGVSSAVEPWTEYLLTDGTVVRMRLVLVASYIIKGETAPNGQPLYQVESTTIMHVEPGTR